MPRHGRHARRAQWAFVAPEAELLDARGAIAGTHYAGPHWESRDGSKIVGSVTARADAPRADAIPWLLLSTRSVGGPGRFANVTARAAHPHRGRPGAEPAVRQRRPSAPPSACRTRPTTCCTRRDEAPIDCRTMPTLQHGRLCIDYADAGQGPPVVLVHSSASGNRQWRRLIERLSPRYRVIAPNLMGNGATTAWHGQRPQTLADAAEVVIGLIEGLQLDTPLALVGHS